MLEIGNGDDNLLAAGIGESGEYIFIYLFTCFKTLPLGGFFIGENHA